MKEEKDTYSKPRTRRSTWGRIIGGDFLATEFVRRQARLLVLIMVLVLFYISNRYECQQQMIRIEDLKKQLTDIKYNALTRNSELMERSRQSRIEEYISSRQSDLQTATTPPYLIK